MTGNRPSIASSFTNLQVSMPLGRKARDDRAGWSPHLSQEESQGNSTFCPGVRGIVTPHEIKHETARRRGGE